MILKKKVSTWLDKFKPGIKFKYKNNKDRTYIVKDPIPTYFNIKSTKRIGFSILCCCLEIEKSTWEMIIYDFINNKNTHVQNNIIFINDDNK